MENLGCTIDGTLNESKFSDPMPWVGVYVVAATVACATAMAADLIHGFRQSKFWFPCNFFSINATTLTLIGVSIKLTVDLNSSMPRRQDQLAKLSSSAFICTIMGNTMPALGTMQNSEIWANIMALIILVITAVANICIELGTGVIYLFWKEHIVLMFLMIVLLGIYCSSAVTVPVTKCYFDLKYRRKHILAVKECSVMTDCCPTMKLKNDLTKYWVMAHTCSPQFVLGRLATCTAAGAFTLLAGLILVEAICRSYFIPGSFRFCNGDSDYKWSITAILITQTIAVAVGTIAPSCRWFMAINFRCHKKAMKACEFKLKVEGYWIQQLLQWRDCPFISRIRSRRIRKLAHAVKNIVFDVCIVTQKGIVLICKIVRLISIFSAGKLLAFHRFFRKVANFVKCHNNVWNDEVESELNPNIELGRFVLHLEGEEVLVDLIVENNIVSNEKWIETGKTEEPKHLLKLLEKCRASEKFRGVTELDIHDIPSLELQEPKNSWALTLVTLTTIAVTIPNIDQNLTKQLARSVHEGLIYVKLVEQNLHINDDLLKVRIAADITWIGVDLHRKWLDVDMKRISEQSKTPEGILIELAETAKRMFFDIMENDKLRCLKEGPSEWDYRALSANSMYRIASAVKLDYETMDYDGGERLFERLSVMIADILAACFTNLPKVIPMECNRSSIEEREGSVHRSFVLLGKLHKIIESLGGVLLPSLEPEELACIDGWRKSSIKKEPDASDLLYLCIE